MKHLLAKFKVKKDKVEEAVKAIETFVQKVETNEPGTKLYKSFREKDDETSFIHIMTFNDYGSEQVHRNSSYVKEFVEVLYPLCEKEPEFTELELIAAN